MKAKFLVFSWLWIFSAAGAGALTVYSLDVGVFEAEGATSDPALKTVVLEATNNETQERTVVVYRGRVGSIDGVRLSPAGICLATGVLPRSGNLVLVMDIPKGETREAIWAMRYSISPASRFIVYESGHPPYGLPENRRSVLMVYDTLRPSSDLKEPLPSGLPLHRDRTPGRPVYPTGDVAYSLLSPILWAEDEQSFVLVGQSSLDLENYLVLVDLSQGLEGLKIAARHINLESFIRDNILEETTRNALKNTPYALHVKEMAWRNGQQVVIQPYRQYWLAEEIVLRTPETQQ